MRTVKILCGGYGLPRKGGFGKHLVLCGETVAVEDAEAERLIALGYASAVVATGEDDSFGEQTLGSTGAAKGSENGVEAHELTEEDLSGMTNPELFKLATDLGLEPKPRAKKSVLVEMILSAQASVPEVTDKEAADGIELPDIEAEAPI